MVAAVFLLVVVVVVAVVGAVVVVIVFAVVFVLVVVGVFVVGACVLEVGVPEQQPHCVKFIVLQSNPLFVPVKFAQPEYPAVSQSICPRQPPGSDTTVSAVSQETLYAGIILLLLYVCGFSQTTE